MYFSVLYCTELYLTVLYCTGGEGGRMLIKSKLFMSADFTSVLRNHYKELEGREGGKLMYWTKGEREEQWRREGGRPTKSNWFRSAGFTSAL